MFYEWCGSFEAREKLAKLELGPGVSVHLLGHGTPIAPLRSATGGVARRAVTVQLTRALCDGKVHHAALALCITRGCEARFPSARLATIVNQVLPVVRRGARHYAHIRGGAVEAILIEMFLQFGATRCLSTQGPCLCSKESNAGA